MSARAGPCEVPAIKRNIDATGLSSLSALSLGPGPHVRATGIRVEDIRDNSIRRRCTAVGSFAAATHQEDAVTQAEV